MDVLVNALTNVPTGWKLGSTTQRLLNLNLCLDRFRFVIDKQCGYTELQFVIDVLSRLSRVYVKLNNLSYHLPIQFEPQLKYDKTFVRAIIYVQHKYIAN